MRREISTLLSNEKVTYIEFQGDLWVTLTFVFSHSQSVLWNFSSLNYINKENKSLFVFSHLFKLHKILKIIITILFYNIVQFILLSFGSIFSRPHVESKFCLPESWIYVISLHQGKDYILLTFPFWPQTYAWKLCNVNTQSTAWLKILECLPWI